MLHEDLHQEEKLAAFAEIYSKAVMNMEENRKSPEVIQFQMEGLKVMTEGVLGIKRDRTGIAETYEKWKQSGQNIHLQQAYQDIYQTARKVLPHLENVLEHSASHQGQGLPVLGDTQKQIETYGGNKRKGQETKMTNQELMDLIKQQIQITDYARENGYTVVRAGRYYSLKEHDSVRIDLKPELLLAELRGRKNRDWKRGQYYWICKRFCTSRKSARSIKGAVRESEGDELSAWRLICSKRRNKKI